MPDPDLGLRALRDVLKPEGAMNLMVYAPYGRAGIYMMQEYCRLLGLSSSDDDLKDLGDALKPCLQIIRSPTQCARALDFKHPDALADALLHPLDRAYSVPQLFDWLEDVACPLAAGLSRLLACRNAE